MALINDVASAYNKLLWWDTGEEDSQGPGRVPGQLTCMDEGLAGWVAGRVADRMMASRWWVSTNCGCEVATDDKREERKEGVREQGKFLTGFFHWLFPCSCSRTARGAASHRAANQLNQSRVLSTCFNHFGDSTAYVGHL